MEVPSKIIFYILKDGIWQGYRHNIFRAESDFMIDVYFRQVSF